MSEPLMSDAELVRRLGAHPDLRSRIEALVLAIEDETGELKTADADELRVMEMMRRTGRDALQFWAQHQLDKTSYACKQASGVWSEGKKNSAGTPSSAQSSSTKRGWMNRPAGSRQTKPMKSCRSCKCILSRQRHKTVRLPSGSATVTCSTAESTSTTKAQSNVGCPSAREKSRAPTATLFNSA